jgi:CelD/BcsL family acetyltransferase involved in cellulose biosynthesis
MDRSQRRAVAGEHDAAGPDAVVLERIPYVPETWDRLINGHPEVQVFHSSAWLSFLAMSQHAEPVVAVVRHHGRCVGFFVGAIVRRFGIRILGSPLRGWGTAYMGFLLEPEFNRRSAADALLRFAFKELGCLHVELGDARLTKDAMERSGYTVEAGSTFVVDLTPTEDEIFRNMNGKTRQHYRKAIRLGVRAEVAVDGTFPDEFHQQLTEVFGRQGLVPTYGIERLRQLIDALLPSGQLLLMRVRGPDGLTIASGVVVARNRTAVNWGAAFFRDSASLHPMEVFWWEAMRYWRARGITTYDMGGRGDYKAKYGGVVQAAPRFHASRFGLQRGRALVRRITRIRQVVSGHLTSRRFRSSTRGAMRDEGSDVD